MENGKSIFGFRDELYILMGGFFRKTENIFSIFPFLASILPKTGSRFQKSTMHKGKTENRITSTSQHGDHHLRDYCDRQWPYESSPPRTCFLFMSRATSSPFKVSSNSLIWWSCGLKQVQTRSLFHQVNLCRERRFKDLDAMITHRRSERCVTKVLE